MTTNVPSKLLLKAAREILIPMGLAQKGRSRLWFDDQGWWLTLVEFQPSGWDKGSYLNVGACWLWSPRRHFAFDEGYRVEPFIRFESEEQFIRAARRLAQRAANEVKVYRERFRTIEAVARYYTAKPAEENHWTLLHAAVVTGAIGQRAESDEYFGCLLDLSGHDNSLEPVTKLAGSLRPSLASPVEFKLRVSELINANRVVLGLKNWNTPLF
jgi:hypothetical protein